MSWSIDVAEKTKEQTGKIVAEQLDKVAQSYADTEEGKDVVAAKGRILALIAAMSVGERDEIYVRAHGSHTWNEKGILSATLAIAIGRGRSGVASTAE